MKKLLLFLSVILFFSCNGFKSIKSAFKDMSPYERYVEALKKAELLNATMAREWLSAGERALSDSVVVNTPFSETGFFQASSPQARSYAFSAKDGQVLTVKTSVRSQSSSKLFVDLFLQDDGKWESVAYGDSTFTLTYEFSNNEECLLRLQPELLANLWYAVDVSLTPVLINPVFGASNKSIGSFYGASRDNGRRSHEGVDIFAPKGTPVVAPTDGYVSRVGVNPLGGKVVWMKDLKRGHSYYFAHLDSQMVKPGMQVNQGHVLGLVGNTGNAKRTPAHLHFGIYQTGSKDPLHYIKQIEEEMASIPIDTGFQQKPYKVRTKKASLHSGPSNSLSVRTSLLKDTYVTVLGQSREWYRVALPDETQGYLLKKDLLPLSAGASQKIDTVVALLSNIHPEAVPLEVLAQNSSVELLARFKDFRFVRSEKGNAGWIAN
jgi:peptidoglycan LD-endopeptidase LytH